MNSVVNGSPHLPFYAERVQSEPLWVARSVAPDTTLLSAHIGAMVKTARYSNFGPCNEALTALLKRELSASNLSLFSSATSALITALRAFEVHGGEVITTPFTFAGTAHAINWAGATPVFADISPHDMTLDPVKVEAAITPATRAILAVHIYGIPCQLDQLADIATRHRLALIYDAAHAFSTTAHGSAIHHYGDATVYSFHASKLFHTGEGGALVCRSKAMQSKCSQMQNFGFDDENDIVHLGSNAKMSEMQAALGLSVHPNIERERDLRARVRATYERELRDIPGVSVVHLPAGVSQSHQYFVVRITNEQPRASVSRRDRVHDVLMQHNVLSRRYFYPLCSQFPHYSGLPSAQMSNLANAEQVSREVLCLPLHSGVSERASVDIGFLIRHALLAC
jgi:dTDP-4-amino-4,6-dideoxygalactose transaminase